MGAQIIAGLTLFLGFLVLALFISLLLALPVMWLWNWLMPVIFGLTKVGLWQAWGLSLLSSLLFKSTSSSSK